MEEKSNSKYCYENGVLINKLGIQDLDLLHKTERNYTTFRISELECGKKKINVFGVNGYLELHKLIFSDIYPFAGKIRDEAIYKSNSPYAEGKTPFCYPTFIYQNLKYYLDEMKENVRKIKSREDLVYYLAHYYGEINMVHPFREGNGRTLRTYLKLYVESINRYLPFDDVEIRYSYWDEYDRELLLRASVLSSINGDSSLLEKVFDKVLVYKSDIKNNVR